MFPTISRHPLSLCCLRVIHRPRATRSHGLDSGLLPANARPTRRALFDSSRPLWRSVTIAHRLTRGEFPKECRLTAVNGWPRHEGSAIVVTWCPGTIRAAGRARRPTA